jgi:hypothetical protein
MFLSANLHSKEVLAREESVSACRSLALQCSDASALEGLLQHLFDVFHGSEGKLTVATHKMSVLQVNKALIRSIMTYASSTLEFAANTHLLKLQHLQNKVLRTIANFPRRAPVRELHKAFNILYIYDYITKLCRQRAEVIQNHENANVRNMGQGEVQHRKHKRLKLGSGQVYDRSGV